MAQVLADRRDIDFALYELFDAEALTESDKFGDLDKKVFDMIIKEARTLAVKEILPTLTEGDEVGLTFENGQVTVPECFHRPYRLMCEGEWNAMIEDPAVGGQGLPRMIDQAAKEYIVAANYSMTTYALEGHGTGKMIELYGTDKQKELFLKKLYTGEWGGTMDLTEPQAGSDLAALETTAEKMPDGTYSLKGNKIFITNAEHDLTPNIIHPVLARVEGAPKGTKGISIFIVPKIWVNEDGSLGDPNDIVCTGVEKKMGIKASATCSTSMGSRGTCRGLLLGEENQGMQVMFHMMNAARLDVGFQGFCNASAAYMEALNYARERKQGKDLTEGKNPDAPQVPIINHPDVRRMLLWMKAHVDGMRSLVYYTARLFDRVAAATDEAERTRSSDLTELLTPLVKAYCAARGFEVCIQAMQVFGGYGYTREYPVELRARDAKIASIYEGTDGIQAMDLLGRKLGMKKGSVFMDLLGEMQATIAAAKEQDELGTMTAAVETAVNRLGEAALHMGKTAMSAEFKTAFAFAHPFLMAMGDVIMAWMHLWRASVALTKLDGAKKKDKDFYDGQIQTARYYIHSQLPATLGQFDAILTSDAAAVEISDAAFGGK
jgi:alkylation response protein AidB-like acyl-CoA dehydrogenase